MQDGYKYFIGESERLGNGHSHSENQFYGTYFNISNYSENLIVNILLLLKK